MTLLKILMPFLLVAAVFFLLVYFFQGKLLFFPGKEELAYCPPLQNMGGEAKEVSFAGERLRFYELSVTKPRGKVILFHGNAGRACDRLLYAPFWQHHQYSLILAEYPGYSGDEQKPREKLIYNNARAMIDYHKKAPGKLIIFGESLGTAPAIYMARNSEVDGLILHTPFYSIEEVAKLHYPYLPISLFLRHKFKGHQFAPEVTAPVLILHGDQDQIVPHTQAEKLAPLFKSKPSFHLFSGFGHNDLFHPAYWQKIELFLSVHNLIE